MSERVLKLGVPPEYFGHAKHFERVFRDLGYTPAQIEAAIKWGAPSRQGFDVVGGRGRR